MTHRGASKSLCLSAVGHWGSATEGPRPATRGTGPPNAATDQRANNSTRQIGCMRWDLLQQGAVRIHARLWMVSRADVGKGTFPGLGTDKLPSRLGRRGLYARQTDTPRSSRSGMHVGALASSRWTV